MIKDLDVVIVGAGPAGLFTAYELITKGLENHQSNKLKIAIVEMGNRASERKCPLLISGLSNNHNLIKGCIKCVPCNIMYGVGGAGALSSGTINLRPDVGGDLIS